jgi:MYND finger
MQCAGCESVFYCCRECQVSHWTAKHKDQCSLLKRLNEAKARKVLGSFEDRHSWRLLDMAGTYRAAVHLGLHDKVREVLENDRSTLFDRFKAGQNLLCHTHWVMFVLFRGNRAEGNDHNYSCMDGQRIKAFVRSHPDAHLVWLQASVQLLRAYLDRDVARNPAAISVLNTVANEVWRGWIDVFTSPVASKAILLPPPTSVSSPPPKAGKDDGSPSSPAADAAAASAATKISKRELAERKRQASIDHATKIILIFREALSLPWTREPDKAVQVSLRSAAAMVHVRLQDYQVPVNAQEMFKLKEMKRHMFRNLFVPVARATIAKGGELDELEMSAVVESITKNVRLRGEGPRR